jgi:hypothetical protein
VAQLPVHADVPVLVGLEQMRRLALAVDEELAQAR